MRAVFPILPFFFVCQVCAQDTLAPNLCADVWSMKAKGRVTTVVPGRTDVVTVLLEGVPQISMEQIDEDCEGRMTGLEGTIVKHSRQAVTEGSKTLQEAGFKQEVELDIEVFVSDPVLGDPISIGRTVDSVKVVGNKGKRKKPCP